MRGFLSLLRHLIPLWQGPIEVARQATLRLLLFENNWLRVQFMLTLNFGTQIDHPERSPSPIDGYHLA